MVLVASVLGQKTKTTTKSNRSFSMVQTVGNTPPASPVQGFIIQAHDGRFLSRGLRFVKHGKKCLTTGLQRAWVHDLRGLFSCGFYDESFGENVANLWPATYDPDKDRTVVTGEPVVFAEALARS